MNKSLRTHLSTVLLIGIFFVLFSKHAIAQGMYCAPNSLPRTCSGSQVCTISGDCGLIQAIFCCNLSNGFPTNTPIPSTTHIPIPTDLPTFPPPSNTPSPTPSIYVGSLTPWYTHNVSATSEQITRSLPDNTGLYLYLVGRSNIGENGGGWSEGSLGFVRKIRISDQSLIWSKTIGQYLGYYVGGINDVRDDGSGVYVSGYTEWGNKLYTAKLNPSTGAVVWEKSDVVAPNTDWSKNRGLGLEIDNDYVYVSGGYKASGSNQSEQWYVAKKSKADGTTLSSRITDLTSGDDIAKDLILSGTYVLVAGVKNGSWYVEKLNKSNLSLVTSKTGVGGSPSTNSILLSDSSSFIITGNKRTTSGGVVYVEKRNISNLNTSWTYTGTDNGLLQSNAHPTLFTGSLVVVANENYIEGYWRDARVMFFNPSNGSVTKNTLYSGVGFSGGLDVSPSGQMYLAGSIPTDSDGAIFLVNEATYTPTPTPTISVLTGCSAPTWVGANNITISGNSFTGTTYSDWNFENGADASTTSTQGAFIGGYAEIPPTNPNYGAMWGLSTTTSYTGWIDYGWYVPYYSGNEIFIVLPGRSAISMGVANPGDRFGVQFSDSSMIFTKSVAGTSSWEPMYVFVDVAPDVFTGTMEFRARVAGYSHIYRANMGTSCRMVTLPTPTPIPTAPVGGNLEPWYSTELSSYPEIGTQVYPDSTGTYVYLVGRRSIGSPFGWHQAGVGFIQKIRKSDKQVVWSRNNIGSSLSYGGLYDVKEDGTNVFITGYTWWGTKLYTAKLNSETGAIVWETEDSMGWSWFPYKGLSFDTDSDHLYIASNATNSDLDTNFSIVKKSKSDGAVVATRSIDFSSDWDAVTNVVVSGGFVYVSGYKSYTSPQWYIEKLNASDLSLVTSVTSVSGVIDMHGMKIEDGYLYVGGFELSQGTSMWSSTLRTRIHVEKRRLSDLGQIWSYSFPLQHMWQSSISLVSLGEEILVTANDSTDRVGWFGSSWVGINLRFVRLNKDNGLMRDTIAYSGVGNVGGMNKDITGEVFLSGATSNRAKTAIFRINDILGQPSGAFGLTVSQRVTSGNVVRGQPIQIKVDIENSTAATQAGWAFSFLDQIPSSIIGVTWNCLVANTGTPRGDMVAYPTKCGESNSGAGNTVTFSHSSSADPLIHPGGKLTVTINGTVAPNAPNIIQSTASIGSYPGWTTNHYYTVNFISSPMGYMTLPDSDIVDNTSLLTITVLNTATATPATSPTRTPTPSITLTPTPTMPYLPSCVDQTQILRTYVNGQIQYYCEDNDPLGHNFIMVVGTNIEKLNSDSTQISNVTFTHKPSTDGQELVTIEFTLKMRGETTTNTPNPRKYSMTVRMR